jgi:hypothetical protein
VILKDVIGDLIFPGQIHGLAVVDARHVPAIYPRPNAATHALVVESHTLDQEPGGSYFMSETRYVLAWFDDESIAQERLKAVVQGYSFGGTHYRMFFAGVVGGRP